jgi:hypothetical protein
VALYLTGLSQFLLTSQFLLDEEILDGGVVGVVGCVLLLGVREVPPLEVSEVEGGVVCDLGVSSAIG